MTEVAASKLDKSRRGTKDDSKKVKEDGIPE
jgi:hypothetical protein